MAKMGRPKNDIVKSWRTRAWYFELEKLLQVDSPFKLAKSLGLLGSDKGSKFRQYRSGGASPDSTSSKLIYAALIKKAPKNDQEVYIQRCTQVFSCLDHPLWEALSGNISVQAGEVGLREGFSPEEYTTEGGNACLLGGEPSSEIVNVPDSSEEYALMKAESEDLFHLLVSGGFGSSHEILLLVLAGDIERYRSMDFRTQDLFENLCKNIKKANDALESNFYITANEIIEYISLWERMGNLNEIEVPESLRLK